MRKSKEISNLDLSVYTKSGKLRKRKPKTKREYFNQDTEDAIVEYVKSSDQNYRNLIFRKYINDSLYKLAEFNINMLNIPYRDVDSIEHLKHEVVCFMLEKFHLYKPSEGKAYSYFTIISRHYLINYNNKQYKIQKDRKEMEFVDEDLKVKQGLHEESKSKEVSHFLKSFIQYVEKSIDDIHKVNITSGANTVTEFVTFSEKDKVIVHTILDLFRRADELEIFYKPALYLQIREATGQSTINITRIIKILKSLMKQQFNIYYKEGTLDIEEADIYNIN